MACGAFPTPQRCRADGAALTAAVHQLLPVFSAGDAIGSAVRRTRETLHRLGFVSETFAEVIDQTIAGEARPARDLFESAQPEDALIYHLSIGSAVAALVERWRGRRVIVYHNITPTRYYAATNQRVAYWLDRGREELRRLAPIVDLVIGVSSYNTADAVQAGARHVAVVPPPIDAARLHPRPSSPSAPPVVLCVGRLAPNKRHDTLLRSLHALRTTAIPHARMVFAGVAHDTETYRDRLIDLADRLGVAGAVDFGGDRVSDRRLGDLYASAAVFATASEHEGFCVPLLEAMAFDVPVVASAEAAIPETVGDAGLLVAERDPLLWAEVLHRAISDPALRHSLIDAGRRRLPEFSDSATERRLAAALAQAGITPPR
jgi:glycosyltransferase involved in cell wall biosynthesis